MIIQLLAVLICSALAASQLAENDTVVDNDLLGDNIIEDEANQTEHVLRFLLLGDWGKGGSTGQYGSSITTDDDQNSSRSITLAADNKNNNNNGGGGGNKNNNKKVFYQIQIAKSMATFATIYHPSFVVALGDNFYNNGVSSTSDILWSYLWKDVYLPYPDLNIPWYPVFGNHDYAGGMTSVRAEIQRTYEHLDDDTWSFPSTNYTKIFYSGTEALLQIIFIDTTTLAPSINKCCNENGGVSKEAQQALIDNQLHHIEAMLNESTISIRPRWLLVAGHYPIFSAGGNGDTLELQSTLLPLLQRHQVHAYLCGHDHISEHLTYEDMHFFVAGAGSMTDKLGAGSNLAQLQWYGIYYSAFGFVEARTDRLTIGYVDINGTMRYNYSLLNPHQVDRADEPPLGPPKGPFGDAKDDIETSHVISTAVVMMGMFCFAVYVFWGRKKGDGEEKVMTKKKCESTGDKAVDRKAEKRALQYSMAVVAQDEWDLEEQRGKSSPLAQQNAGKTARLQRFLGRRGEAAQRSPLVTEPRCKYQAIAEPEAMEENNSTATVSKRDITIAGQPTRCNRTLGPQLDDQWLEQGDTEVTAVSEEEECQEQEENVASVATESFLLQSNPLFAGSSYITTDDIPSPTRNNISPNPSNSPSRSHRRCHTSPM